MTDTYLAADERGEFYDDMETLLESLGEPTREEEMEAEYQDLFFHAGG